MVTFWGILVNVDNLLKGQIARIMELSEIRQLQLVNFDDSFEMIRVIFDSYPFVFCKIK